MTKKQINEFLNRLEGEEGCNFKEKIKGDPNSISWNCDSSDKYPLAKKVLTLMGVPKDEQKDLLEKAQESGGYCDCEILFNADEYLLNNYK